ncbi:uncharacterized protein LOC106640413 [Copidosoma floridanum]|uniref:uncharacterized protein LOC106640413 n=1 Tax=Copidosoma floridanum TaxID=29053 RepID=UPI0006C93EA9|nr:uncharacterized protein LOC106640413 [Copidosoma floridanum]
MPPWDSYHLPFLIVLVAIAVSVSGNGQLTSKEHRTHAASERKNDLWCYRCDTIDEGDTCVSLAGNDSHLMQKCKDDKRLCMVKRFSYTTSTENSTSEPMMWGMERNCTNKCEPGCIVIGERTKLYSCTSCCDWSLCNTGSGQGQDIFAKELEFFLALAIQILLTFTLYPS